MNDQKMSKQGGAKDGINPVVVAVAGAVVGAGIAVAGVVLSDEKNREKIVKAANTVRDDVTHYVEKTQKQVENCGGWIIISFLIAWRIFRFKD